jgi:hypothetical protein
MIDSVCTGRKKSDFSNGGDKILSQILSGHRSYFHIVGIGKLGYFISSEGRKCFTLFLSIESSVDSLNWVHKIKSPQCQFKNITKQCCKLGNFITSIICV